MGTDNVTIGGLTITGQTVELAKTLSTEFASGVGDGLLGLAWDSINTVSPNPAKTPVDNLISQGQAAAGFFTAYLGSWRDAEAADKGESFYTFGFLDQAVMDAAGATEPAYTPVDNSQGFWQFASASFSLNGTETARAGNTAIADTGTTLALVDDATCKAIYDAIPGSSYDSSQQGYVFPATVTPAQLPTVGFAVGDKIFTIPKESLAFADAGNGNVYGGVQSRGTMTFDILGDTFLKGIYAVRFVAATCGWGTDTNADPRSLTSPRPASARCSARTRPATAWPRRRARLQVRQHSCVGKLGGEPRGTWEFAGNGSRALVCWGGALDGLDGGTHGYTLESGRLLGVAQRVVPSTACSVRFIRVGGSWKQKQRWQGRNYA